MNRVKTALASALLSITVASGFAENFDFSNGVFILNEDWYGHNNSTINFWNTKEGYVDYLLFQSVNPEHSFGATAQYAQIFGNRMYVMSKQDRDPGDNTDLQSGRLTVISLPDFKCLHQLAEFETTPEGRSLADGRGCVGVADDKVYLGTSNGIYVYRPSENAILGKIAGTENPMITGGEAPGDGQGPLYHNQIGMMIRTQDWLFAIQQDRGILVIDYENDKIEAVIEGCFSTMVQDCDGNIWAGANANEEYAVYPYGNNGDMWEGNRLLKIDPFTLQTETIELSEAGVNNSWYAWTGGMLAADASEPYLYFVYHDPSLGQQTWFSSNQLFSYDIQAGKVQEIYDSGNDDLHFYGCGLRADPRDGLLYATLYAGDNIATQDWVYSVLDSTGAQQNYFMPIKRYWYPGLVVFPDMEAPVVEDMPEALNLTEDAVTITLGDKVSDADTPHSAIIYRIAGNSDDNVATATLDRYKLTITPLADGTTDITVLFDANGLTAEATIKVEVSGRGGGEDGIATITDDAFRLYAIGGRVIAKGNKAPVAYTIRNLQGIAVATGILQPDSSVELPGHGVWIVTAGNNTIKTTY